MEAMPRALAAFFFFLCSLGLASLGAQQFTEAQQKAATEAIALLDEAVAGLQDQDAGTLRRALDLVPAAYGRASQPEMGRTALRRLLSAVSSDEAVPPDTRAAIQANAVLHLANLGFPTDAAELAEAIPDPTHRSEATAWAVYGFARAGDLAAAQRMTSAIMPPSARDQAYEHIVYECSRRADFACASSAIDSITDPSAKPRLLDALARAKARKGAADQAAADLEKARDIALQLPDAGVPKNIRRYAGCEPLTWPSPRDEGLRQVAESQARAGQAVAARQTLHSIQDPDARETALVALALTEARNGALPVALSIAGEVTRPDCRSVVFSAVAFRQFVSGDTNGAWRTIDQIPALHERVYALMNIAMTQRARRTEIVGPTLAKASQAALQEPDSGERLALLLEVASRQMRGAFLVPARSTLLSARITANEQPPDGSSNVAVAESGQAAFPPRRNWNSLLVSLASLLAENGDVSMAAEVAGRVQAGLYPAPTLARGAARGGHAEAARAWADSLPDTGDRAMALVGIAIGILDRAGIGYTPNAAVW